MVINEVFSKLICKLSNEGKYSFYFPKKGDYFCFSDGLSIISINYDNEFGLTSSLCYIPNKEHGSSMRISELKNNDYDKFINDIEHFISLQKNNPSELQYILNRYKIKNKVNVKFYKNIDQWKNESFHKQLIESNFALSLNQLKKGINEESTCVILGFNNNISFVVNEVFYQGFNDVEKIVSNVLFNRQFKNYDDLQLTIIQNKRYINQKMKNYYL